MNCDCVSLGISRIPEGEKLNELVKSVKSGNAFNVTTGTKLPAFTLSDMCRQHPAVGRVLIAHGAVFRSCCSCISSEWNIFHCKPCYKHGILMSSKLL